MTARLCRNCGHKGVDVDDNARCHFCRADDTSPTSSRHMHALLAALGKKAPALDAKERAEKTQAGRARIYEATPEMLGCASAADVWHSLQAGTLGLDDTAAGFERTMRALAVIRAACFKHEKATYTATDCPHVRAALAVHSVQVLAKAIGAAAKDKWFSSKKSITFVELKDKAPMLLAEASKLSTSTDARRLAADAVVADIAKLKTLSAVDAAELDINLGMLGLDAIRAHHETVKRRIAEWT